MKRNKVVKIRDGKENNFNILRWIAAVVVIISHSYPLFLGREDPLFVYSKGMLSIGGLAVDIFFLISGYLITMSFIYKKSLSQFIQARLLRIYPALIIAVLISALIIGPIFTKLTIPYYFKSEEVYLYIIRGVSAFKPSFSLPGVFVNNIYPNVINGSLWTIPFEILCYLFVFLLGVAQILKNKFIIPLTLLLCTGYFLNTLGIISSGENLLRLFSFFMFGMLFFLNRKKIVLHIGIASLSLIVLIINLSINLSPLIILPTLAYLVFYISFNEKIKFSNFGRKIDLSYGIYLYAFPVQQIIVTMFGIKFPFIINLIAVFVFTFLISLFSWYAIEKPTLALKNVSIKQLLIK